MSVLRSLRRPALVGAAAVAAVAVGAAPALAHHCFVPMYSLNEPASANWFPVSAELGAFYETGFEAGCEAAVEAGYDALRAEGLPVGIKIFEKMTIGDPKHTGRLNPNGADGRGLEYFGADSPVPVAMVTTWVEGAESVDCG
ncbi:hypothetical protein GCM10023168_25550 [Fodinibacter luteus]|uniref:Uncharacterized protein n=1 Tax=Fodinibacter luteus TaxID=552064 RepID=A0ABP8KJ80_9MICO